MTFKIATAFVAVEADDAGLRTSIAAKIDAATQGQGAKVRLDLDVADLRAKIQAATAGGATDTVTLDLDSADLRAKVIEAVRAAESGIDVIVGIDLDVVDLREKVIDAVRAAESGIKAIIGTDLDDVGLKAKVKAAAAAAGATAKVKVDVEDAGAAGKLGNAGNAANNASSGFLGLSGKVWTLVGAVSALGPVLAAVPAMLVGAGAAVGTLGLGLGSAVKALRDYGAQASATGQSSSQMAATSFADAVAVKGAEQAITDAKKQAAQTAVTSAEQVANAQQAVGDAARAAAQASQSSAAQIVSAQQQLASSTYAVGQAEQSETNSAYAELQARQALTQAQADAANTITDLNNAMADSHLQVESATQGVTDAQLNLNAVLGSSLSSPGAKTTADRQYRIAVQALTDAKQKDLEATQKADLANKQGVTGLPAVVNAQHAVQQAAEATAAAQHGVTVALQSQADAQRALVVAQQNAANQQITSDESVARARQSLGDALRNADQQRLASIQQVTRAEQALADMRTQQALAAAAAAAASSGAANQFAKDMRGMTQQGRDFVNEALTWRTSLHQLSDTAQVAMLPGFTQMLQGAKSMLPVVNAGVNDMGHQLGTTAIAFGHLFQNPAFQASARQFSMLVTSGFGQFASALPPMLSGIVTAGVQAGPIINAVALGIHDILASGLPNFLSGLSVNAGGAAQGVGALFSAVNDLLGPFGTLVGATSGALGPALAGLEPSLKILADDIVTGLLPAMPALSQALLDVSGILQQLVPIVAPLIPMIAGGLAAALRELDGPLKDTATFLKDNAAWLTPVAGGILGLVVAVKTWNTVSGLADTATKQWKKSMELFGSEGTIATKATKAWGVATSDTLAVLGKGVGVGGIIIGASLALAGLQEKLASLGQIHLNDSDVTKTLLDVAQGAQGADKELSQLADNVNHDQITKFNTNLQAVDQSLAEMVSSGHADQARVSYEKFAAAVDKVQIGGQDVRGFMSQYNKSLTDTSNASREATLDTGKTGDALKVAADKAANAQQPFSGLALRLGDVNQAGKNTNDQLFALDKTLHGLDAQMAKQQALDDYTKALDGIAKGAAGSSTSLDGNTDSARANRQQLEDGVTTARHFYDSQIAAGVSVDQANTDFLNQVDALRQQAQKTYDSKDAVDHFLDSLGLVPTSKTTKVTVDTSDGIKTIDTFQKSVDAVHGAKIRLTIEKIYGPGDQEITIAGLGIKANAAGGPVAAGDVSVVGERGPELVVFDRPGTVIPNDQLQRPRQVGAQHQAPAAPSPGPSRPPININYYGTQHPTVEQKAIMMRELALAVQ
jgi:hypothetical protein